MSKVMDISLINMDSETITIKRKISYDLTFKEFKKILKSRIDFKKATDEEVEKYWNELKKRPNLGLIITLYGSMCDEDDAHELYEKVIKKELKSITIDCLKFKQQQEEED